MFWTKGHTYFLWLGTSDPLHNVRPFHNENTCVDPLNVLFGFLPETAPTGSPPESSPGPEFCSMLFTCHCAASWARAISCSCTTVKKRLSTFLSITWSRMLSSSWSPKLQFTAFWIVLWTGPLSHLPSAETDKANAFGTCGSASVSTDVLAQCKRNALLCACEVSSRAIKYSSTVLFHLPH